MDRKMKKWNQLFIRLSTSPLVDGLSSIHFSSMLWKNSKTSLQTSYPPPCRQNEMFTIYVPGKSWPLEAAPSKLGYLTRYFASPLHSSISSLLTTLIRVFIANSTQTRRFLIPSSLLWVSSLHPKDESLLMVIVACLWSLAATYHSVMYNVLCGLSVEYQSILSHLSFSTTGSHAKAPKTSKSARVSSVDARSMPWNQQHPTLLDHIISTLQHLRQVNEVRWIQHSENEETPGFIPPVQGERKKGSLQVRDTHETQIPNFILKLNVNNGFIWMTRKRKTGMDSEYLDLRSVARFESTNWPRVMERRVRLFRLRKSCGTFVKSGYNSS